MKSDSMNATNSGKLDKDVEEAKPLKEDQEINKNDQQGIKPKSGLRSLLGLLVLFLSASSFTSSNALVKLIQHVDAFSLSAIRYAVVAILSAVIIVARGSHFFPKGFRTYLAIRGFLGSFTLIVHFYALKQMPMGDVNMISASTPVITVFLAWLLLSESVRVIDLVHALLVCLGVALITQPPILFGQSEQYVLNENYGMAAIMVVLSSFTMAAAFIVLRKLKDVSFATVLFVYGVEGCVCSTLTGLLFAEVTLPESTSEWLGSLAIGVLSFSAQALMTVGCQMEQAALVSLLRKTLDAFLAFGMQFVIFSEFPNLLGAMGIAIMLLVVINSGLNKICSDLDEKNGAKRCYDKIFCKSCNSKDNSESDEKK